MVRLTKIYTKTGDKGDTGLGDGSRVAKHDLRVEAYGTVDEANAVIGLARLHTDQVLDGILARIQNDLFDVGADLCTPFVENPKYPPLRLAEAKTLELEQEIDKFNADMPSLQSFILPAGDTAATHLHHARTVTRRAERIIVQLKENQEISQSVLEYMNRLSDLLFVLARYANGKGKDDVLWVPGK
ncbi:cob(I)yrinic acid a,c-diamide adenosyltransferase [Marinobacter salarius]|jgi:cob(I)alamin adenosyltransferase|uniref:cob(I)yrinic acid a,c-diamide adenosyltransferase n=1 Tax=Marinobacter salarius TaxID=1420917 RepID=UPI0032F00B7A|tara:strand:- start:1675 stop:2232 length:558 start_codon:yes stop_codon:yes gene_type:complete